MKNIVYSLFFLIIIALVSCDNAQDRETSHPDSTSVNQDTVVVDSFSVTPLGQLIKSDTGLFRGVAFGTSKEDVRKLEAGATLEEEENEYLDYLINYNFPESAEVIYSFDKAQKVNKIEAIIYADDSTSQRETIQELTQYFDRKYGIHQKPSEGIVEWQNKEAGLALRISKKGTHKVHDIYLDFVPLVKV